MNTTARVALFVVSLFVVFGVAAAVGNAVGPFDDDPPVMRHTESGH